MIGTCLSKQLLVNKLFYSGNLMKCTFWVRETKLTPKYQEENLFGADKLFLPKRDYIQILGL